MSGHDANSIFFNKNMKIGRPEHSVLLVLLVYWHYWYADLLRLLIIYITDLYCW